MTPDPLSDGAAGTLSAAIPSLGEGYFAAPLSPLASKLRHNAVSSTQAWNAFVYVTGSPATRVDPSGLCGQPCDPTLDPNCVCDPTTDPFCGCDPTFGPDCGGCGADRPCRCNPAVDPTCGGPIFVRVGGSPRIFLWTCTRQWEKPKYLGICGYGCHLVSPPGQVGFGETLIGTARLTRECRFPVTTTCPYVVEIETQQGTQINGGKIVRCQQSKQWAHRQRAAAGSLHPS